MEKILPSYIELYESGKLKERVEELKERLKSCDVCPTTAV